MTPVPDFPSELVEAAAKAYEDGWRESRGDHSVALGQSLAAVLPRIEQRVKEAGEPWSSLRKGEEAANLARYYAGLAGFTLAEYGDEKEVLRVFRTTGDARASENPYPVDPFESGHSIRRGAWDVGYAAGRSDERARCVKLLREEAAVEAHAPGHEAAWEALNRCANALAGDAEVCDCCAEAEQRVIDRLAREAGSNPYTPAPAARHYDAQSDDVIRESAWDEGVACGVAAERARCPLCDHEWRRHDPEDGRCDCHSETTLGPCQCGRDIVWMQERIAAMSLAALASERTTGELCETCKGTGSLAPSVPGLLNYIKCPDCDGRNRTKEEGT